MINEIFKTPLYQTKLKLDNVYIVYFIQKDNCRYQSNDLFEIPVLN